MLCLTVYITVKLQDPQLETLLMAFVQNVSSGRRLTLPSGRGDSCHGNFCQLKKGQSLRSLYWHSMLITAVLLRLQMPKYIE